ncbi:hypothetical protein F0P96_10905 [Hymenobacter busanensis]|uniref:Uncharacterized protein n=1 Tax=Hymenobacter busanensis TaxID=2607656 RepID=A0A7L4ZWG9_9BACT|nr:hypothetical protein [Hymenobacter busanensis]KAA9333469.1 hypothetical protein F0P96_10905 [Hymenobacter busanensis]QHJ07849.1 hypothetical protein GUY19_11385 [Hymenobacter busanensis]
MPYFLFLCALFLELFLSGSAVYAQLTSQATDLNGRWQTAKAGSEFIIDVTGPAATIRAVMGKGVGPAFVGGHLYDSIRYVGHNTWRARRNYWQPRLGATGDEGYWAKAEWLRLYLSPDKNTLTDSAHWTLYRFTPGPATAAVPRRKIVRDLGGVTGTFRLEAMPKGVPTDFIVADLANRTTDQRATVLLKAEDGKVRKLTLDPKVAEMHQFSGRSLEVQVLYHPYKAPKQQLRLFELVPGQPRTIVSTANREISASTVTPRP